MTEDLSKLTAPQLSAVFAEEVAGWTYALDPEKFGPLAWRERNELGMPKWVNVRQIPAYATSLDALLPFMFAPEVRSAGWQLTDNGKECFAQVGQYGRSHANPATALATALILWKRAQKGNL